MTHPDPTSLLRMQGVRFAYGEQDVVAGVDLRMDRGEIVVVVGPNGAGKSTLLRLASGLLDPSAGRVTVDGEDVRQVPRRLLARKVAGVASEEEVAFPFSVRESVEIGRHPWRGAFAALSADERDQIDAALAAVDLLPLADRSLAAVSSGERQRAAIARCLVQEGDLLLLDEPTVHLDLGHRLRTLALFRARARERDQGLLAVLHDLNLAALAADRVLLMVAGRIAAEGPPADVLTAAHVHDAFGARVEVLSHPANGRPVIVPVESSA